MSWASVMAGGLVRAGRTCCVAAGATSVRLQLLASLSPEAEGEPAPLSSRAAPLFVRGSGADRIGAASGAAMLG